MTLITPRVTKSYVPATRSDGSFIFDADGNRWLDGASSSIACSVGHAHPTVTAALAEASTQSSFVYRTQFTSPHAERLAKRLCEKLGYTAAFFVNSGSEAVETATRLAQQYWRERGKPTKTQILSRRLSYHGSTTATLGLSGHWPRRRASGPLYGAPTQPTPYCLRCPLGLQPGSCATACANELEREIAERGADQIAAFLLEPVVGASGAAILPPKDYITRIRSLCDRHGILLITDEVLTGLGRTGRWLAMDHYDVKSDIVCLGKGLNAGYFPISGVLVSSDVYMRIVNGTGSFELGHTHSNHPVGAAAANAVLDVLEDEDLVPRADRLGQEVQDRLAEMCAHHAIVGDVRGRGLFFGLELVDPEDGDKPFPAEMKIAARAVETAFELGLILYPASGFAGALGGDALIVAPPLNISASEVNLLLTTLSKVLNTLEESLNRNQWENENAA